MKLIQKINQRNLSFSLIILVLMGIALYVFIKLIIADETDEKLQHTFQNVTKQLSEEPQLILLKPYIEVSVVDHLAEAIQYKDTLILDDDNEYEEFRQLTAIYSINGQTYNIVLRESILESEDLIETLIWLIGVSLIILFSGLFLLNIRVSKSVWAPFNANIKRLKAFNLQEMDPFLPIETDIIEFSELNSVLKNLTNKVISDYIMLRKFSENASHELQTPLAIIRSKTESLLDGNALNDTQVAKIQSIYQSVNRLTKINKDLLFITKIENSQFNNIQRININRVVENQLAQFKELADLKQIKFVTNFISIWEIEIDNYLAETLISNLITNAILHNVVDGNITIEISENCFTISNSGNNALIESDKLFDRFYKGKTSGSTGLGLSIVYEICRSLSLSINYSFVNNYHLFTITKNKL